MRLRGQLLLRLRQLLLHELHALAPRRVLVAQQRLVRLVRLLRLLRLPQLLLHRVALVLRRQPQLARPPSLGLQVLDLDDLPLVLGARDPHRLLERRHLRLRRLRARLGHGLRVGRLLHCGGGGLRRPVAQQPAQLLDLRLKHHLLTALGLLQRAQRAQLLPVVVHCALQLDFFLQLELVRLLERAKVALGDLSSAVWVHAGRCEGACVGRRGVRTLRRPTKRWPVAQNQ